MAIVSSVRSQDNNLQKDGTRYVRELHIDNVGKRYLFEYLATSAMMANVDAVMAARAARLEAELPESEADGAIEVDRAPVLAYQTGAQFLQRLRQRYRDAQPEKVVRIARWIARRIDAGDVTVAQLRAAFGLTVQQWNTLEAKMRDLAAALNATETAVGE